MEKSEQSGLGCNGAELVQGTISVLGGPLELLQGVHPCARPWPGYIGSEDSEVQGSMENL